MKNKDQNDDSKPYCIYVYVSDLNEKVVYIGKTNQGVRKRYLQHMCLRGVDVKFRKYKGHLRVFYMHCEYKELMDAWEDLLIGYFAPELNCMDKYHSAPMLDIRDSMNYADWYEFVPDGNQHLHDVSDFKKIVDEKSTGFQKMIENISDDELIHLYWKLLFTNVGNRRHDAMLRLSAVRAEIKKRLPAYYALIEKMERGEFYGF